MNSMKRFLCLLLLAMPVAVWAVPSTINFQGKLVDDNGVPVTQASMSFKVSIHTADVGGSQLYIEDHSVDVDDGAYSLQIGGGTGQSPTWNPTSLFGSGASRYVEIQVHNGVSFETLTPRHPLLSAPFTLQASNSDGLGGQPISYFGTASQISSLNSSVSSLNSDVSALQSAMSSTCQATGNIWNGSSCEEGLEVIWNDEAGAYFPINLQPGLTIQPQYGNGYCNEAFYAMGQQPVADCDGNTYYSDPGSQSCSLGPTRRTEIIPIKDCAYPVPNPAAG